MEFARTASSYPILALLLAVGASHCSGAGSPDAAGGDSMVPSDAVNDMPTVGSDTPNATDVVSSMDTPNALDVPAGADVPNAMDVAQPSDANPMDTGVVLRNDVIVADTFSDANATDGAQSCVQMGGVCQMYVQNPENRLYYVTCPIGRTLPNGQMAHGAIRTPGEAMSAGCQMPMGDGATIAAFACCR